MNYLLNSSSPYNGGDGDQTLRASSSSTPILGQHYEVFLSFRGETRRGFTDHLYKRLDNAGILVFRDKEGLNVGEKNWPELVKAIETSEISIPIISPGYASSTWCLNELLQILKCKKNSDQLVKPIFYHVKPSDIRELKGDFGKAFQLLQEKPNSDGVLIQEWKNALVEVSLLTGWELEKIADGYEATLVDIILADVLKALKRSTLVVNDDLVGIEEKVEKIMEDLNVEGSNDGRAILIHGMGGIGKTTLAKVVYNKLSYHFKHRSYIANIREASSQYKGMESLQKQLISDILGEKWPQDIFNVDEGVNIIRNRFNQKNVLLLLDDIDNRNQLNMLAGRQDWFGRGSMFIITSRRKDILEKWEGSFSYELNELTFYQSFELFCKHAFKRRDSIPNEYDTITKEIVFTTGGLPLAIEVIGSLLYEKSKTFWEENLKMLKEIPHEEVQSKLKVSFDTLQQEDKEMFLDIACVPSVNIDKLEFVVHMWDSCGFYPLVRIQKLVSMSLIKVEKIKEAFGEEREIVIMHDQLRDLGRDIVRQESLHDIGRRRRLWKDEEAWEVLELMQETVEVETLVLASDKEVRCTSKQFEGMKKLRFLRMQDVLLEGDFGNLFQNLRWLEWINTSESIYTDFMGINLNFRKLVILELVGSNISEHWKGWSQIKHLKVLALYRCNHLTATPDFSSMKKLEHLCLFGCSNLERIDPSIGKLRKTLKFLDLRGCSKLKELPIEVGEMEELRALLMDAARISEIPISEGYMTKLETLSTYSCYCLEEIPKEVGKMKELKILNIGGTGIREIPISKGCMKKLEILIATCCEGLTSIPDSLGSLGSLLELELIECRMLTKIPESIGKLKSLTQLDLSRTGVTQLPDAIGDLCNLEVLLMPGTPIKYLPTSIGMLSKLQELDLYNCKELELMLSLPSSLTSLKFNGDSIEILPDFSNLTKLIHLTYRDLFERRDRALNLGNLNQLRMLRIHHSMTKLRILDSQEIEVLNSAEEIDVAPKNINLLLQLPPSLVYLEIVQCQTLRILPSLSNLKNLYGLCVCQCSELLEINDLDRAKSLTYMRIEGCKRLSKLNGKGISVNTLILMSLDALESFPQLSTAENLRMLHIFGCNNLVEIQGLDNVEGIKRLVIGECSSLERIGDLSRLKMLTSLTLYKCKELRDAQGMEKLSSLTALAIFECRFKLSDLSMLRNLETLAITDSRITEILGLQELKSLEHLIIAGCMSLQNLPDLSRLTNLKKLDLCYCGKLSEIRGLEHLPFLKELDISGCSALRNLPDLPNVEIKSDLHDDKEEGEVQLDSSESPINADPLEENEERGYLRDLSQFTKSNDVVEKSCLDCPALGCFPISEMLRSLMTHLKGERKGADSS